MKNWDELDLFYYLVNCCYPDLVKARKQMSRWDCYSPNTSHRIELKCRGKHYDTLLIEKKKYDAMMEKAIDNYDIPIYINSTPNGVYRFNLNIVKPKWEIQYHNKTTNFNERQKIEKEVAMLPIIDAEIL